MTEFVLTGTHSYGFSELKFFVPFTNKGLQGHYKIDDVVPFIGKKDGKPELRMRLRLSNYTSYGEWKKTDRGLPHPDLYTHNEIFDIYDSGIMFLPIRH